MRTSTCSLRFCLAPLCDFTARLFITAVIVAGLLVLEPVVTLIAGFFFAGFYFIFMRITRKRVRSINEVSRETSRVSADSSSSSSPGCETSNCEVLGRFF